MSTGFDTAGGLAVILKDPADVLDYTVDWSDWLDTDTITGTPTWTVTTGVTKASQSNTTTTTTAWLSGGTAGSDYTVACKIVTTGGRTVERSFTVQVRDR
jgi:hypothetical protein